MTIFSLAGCAGVGLVWGWLLGGLEGEIRRPGLTFPILALVTLTLAAQVGRLLGWPGAILLGAAGLLAFFLRVLWRRSLRRRFPSLPSTAKRRMS